MDQNRFLLVTLKPIETSEDPVNRRLHPDNRNHIVVDSRSLPPAIFFRELLRWWQQIQNSSNTCFSCKPLDICF
jgi:hypothetical protein